VPDLAFTHDTPDGYFLVSACLDNKAMLRDGQSGDWIGTFMGHKGRCSEQASDRGQRGVGASRMRVLTQCTTVILSPQVPCGARV
jgi:hypothetical protein